MKVVELISTTKFLRGDENETKTNKNQRRIIGA